MVDPLLDATTLWGVERKIINQIVGNFNASQSDGRVTIESFPQFAYNGAVVAAARAGDLPAILDVDGAGRPNWAWADYLQPLPIDQSKIEAILPGTNGAWNDQLYFIGLWDAAVSLVARQPTLGELGLRTPTLEEPWNHGEFVGALDAARASGKFEYPLDLARPGPASGIPTPSRRFGGDIVDRTTY